MKTSDPHCDWLLSNGSSVHWLSQKLADTLTAQKAPKHTRATVKGRSLAALMYAQYTRHDTYHTTHIQTEDSGLPITRPASANQNVTNKTSKQNLQNKWPRSFFDDDRCQLQSVEADYNHLNAGVRHHYACTPTPPPPPNPSSYLSWSQFFTVASFPPDCLFSSFVSFCLAIMNAVNKIISPPPPYPTTTSPICTMESLTCPVSSFSTVMSFPPDCLFSSFVSSSLASLPRVTDRSEVVELLLLLRLDRNSRKNNPRDKDFF